jgi:hypothetical protein
MICDLRHDAEIGDIPLPFFTPTKSLKPLLLYVNLVPRWTTAEEKRGGEIPASALAFHFWISKTSLVVVC